MYAVSSIQPKDWALSGATIPGQNGPGSDGNEGVLCIPQSSSITGTLQSDSLVLYPGHSLVGCYPSAEVQSVYPSRQGNQIRRIIFDWSSKETPTFSRVVYLNIEYIRLSSFLILLFGEYFPEMQLLH